MKQFNKGQSLSFLQENGRMIAQFILTALFVGLAIWFVAHQKTELFKVRDTLLSSRLPFLILGLVVTAIYIGLQGMMYFTSFRSINSRLPLLPMIILYLKRNFISIFLPAGGVSSLAFFSNDIEKRGASKSQIFFASYVYGFAGIASVVIVAIPVLLISLVQGTLHASEIYSMIASVLLLLLMYAVYRSVKDHGLFYKNLIRFFPSLKVIFEEWKQRQVNRKAIVNTLLISIGVDLVGILHIFIAMNALSLHASLFAALMSYLIAILFLTISPFLRGLGAIEFSMTYVLSQMGYSNVEAISITLLYRFFEFWLPLFAGVYVFLMKINKLILRIVPALLLLLLGVVNILSVLSPNGHHVHFMNFIPIETITPSNYFILTAGLFMFINSAFLLKGLRAAWWMAFILVLISFVAHLTKAINYEDAFIAFIVLIILFFTRKEYYIKTDLHLQNVGLKTALLSMIAVLIYGTIGFFFLDKRYFDVDFTMRQSLKYTLLNYFLIGSSDLHPTASFARDFLYSINISGFFSLSFLFYTMIRPFVIKDNSSPEQLAHARELIKRYGHSGMDYFKTYYDKLIFISSESNAFISYRVASNYAVVLENPVGEDVLKIQQCITQFDKYCNDRGMKSLFYRVPEEDLSLYQELGKKALYTGQEGVVDLSVFKVEGGNHKSLRNSINKVKERGFKINVFEPPLKDGLLQKLKSVSDEWLDYTGRKEIIFSQGSFQWGEIKQQTVLTVGNSEEKIIAFLNVIPDFAKEEMTFDLMRKTQDAPNGVMDFLLIELFNYAKSLNYKFVNLGFVPLSGLEDPQSFPERSMKFAYEKIRLFSHYKGLREFKEKFSPLWYNKYLIYENDYDLLQAPAILTKVIKP